MSLYALLVWAGVGGAVEEPAVENGTGTIVRYPVRPDAIQIVPGVGELEFPVLDIVGSGEIVPVVDGRGRIRMPRRTMGMRGSALRLDNEADELALVLSVAAQLLGGGYGEGH